MPEPDCVSLLSETITRLEGHVPQVYPEQCKAMVRAFVHVWDTVSSGGYSSRPIFQELHRLACEAERVLEGFCKEHQWLQAVVFTDSAFTDPKWSIFRKLWRELILCFNILLENESPAVRRLTEDHRVDIVELDRNSLKTKLLAMREAAAPELHQIVELVLARLDDADGRGDAVACWSGQQFNCGVMNRFRSWLLTRHWIVTPGFTAVDLDVFTINDRVEGVRNVIPPGALSIVTRNLEWAGVSPLAEKAFTRFPETDRNHRRLRRLWLKEVCIMAHLNHPNVVRFIGCTSQGDDHGPTILMESEDMSLKEYITRLQRKEDENRMAQIPAAGRIPAEPLLDNLVAVDILTQIASGMAYLHGQDVAHLDLKLDNLLLSSSMELPDRPVSNRVKIADFGHSIHLKGLAGKIRNRFPNNHGTTIYRAPELFFRGRMVCMKAADVCSFGFTCWAILHCEEPRLPKVSAADYHEQLVGGSRLGFHKLIPKELQYLIKRCWDTDPGARPGFSEIYHFLESYKGKLLGSQSSLVQFQ